MAFLTTLSQGVMFATIAAATIVFALIFAYTFVTIHEYGHALSAQYLGYKTKDISLYPMAGLASISGDWHKNPLHEFIITICGPLTNLVMFSYAWIILQFCEPETIEHALFDFAFRINVALLVFNVLPVYPMDGGRILRSAISYFSKDWYTGTIWATRTAFICGLVAIPIGFYLSQPIAGFMIAFMGLFVAQAEMSSLKSRKEIEEVEAEQLRLFENLMMDESLVLWPDDAEKRKEFVNSMVEFHKFLSRFVIWAVQEKMNKEDFGKVIAHFFVISRSGERREEMNAKAKVNEIALFEELSAEALNENRAVDSDAQSSAA